MPTVELNNVLSLVCTCVCIARPQGSTIDTVTDVSLQYLWFYSGTPLNGHPCRKANCDITARYTGPNEEFVHKTTTQQRPPLYNGQNCVPQRCPL